MRRLKMLILALFLAGAAHVMVPQTAVAQIIDLGDDDPVAVVKKADDYGGRGWKAGKFFGRAAAIGVGTGSTAVIARGFYTGATEHREMMYGEAFCTAENWGIPGLKVFRIVGDLVNGRLTPISEVIFCPEDKLNAAYSPALYTKVHRVKKKHRRR